MLGISAQNLASRVSFQNGRDFSGMQAEFGFIRVGNKNVFDGDRVIIKRNSDAPFEEVICAGARDDVRGPNYMLLKDLSGNPLEDLYISSFRHKNEDCLIFLPKAFEQFKNQFVDFIQPKEKSAESGE